MLKTVDRKTKPIHIRENILIANGKFQQRGITHKYNKRHKTSNVNGKYQNQNVTATCFNPYINGQIEDVS